MIDSSFLLLSSLPLSSIHLFIFPSPPLPPHPSSTLLHLPTLLLSSLLQLLRMHPDVNLANEHGNTALHYASFWNYIGICEVRSETEHHHGFSLRHFP